jgi:hypothetical protein
MSKAIAYDFVLDYLFPLTLVTRPMFGCHGIYAGEKIVLITRKKGGPNPDNGVWVVTTPEHLESLKKDFPFLRAVSFFSEDSKWQVLSEDAPDFEADVIRVCELIVKGDPRIGTIPKKKKKKVK